MSVAVSSESPPSGDGFTAETILDMARSASRMAAMAEALLLTAAGALAILREDEALAEMAQIRLSGRRLLWDGHDARQWAADELAVAVRIGSGAAARRLDDGQRLVTDLPQVLTALGAGTVDARGVRALLDETERLDAADAGLVCDHVLEVAAGMTAGQVRRTARRQALRVAPQTGDQAYRDGMRRRQAQTWASDTPGMACLRVEGPAERVAAAWQAATALAMWRVDRGDDGSLTLDQARADAVLDLVSGLGSGHTTGTAAATADIAVTVIAPPGGAPAELIGHGPLPPAATPQPGDERVRAVQRWDTDAAGVVTATGTAKGYVPSPRLAATVRARDLTCRFPGCPRRAERCDLDHVVPWPAGSTEYGNLAALCRRHHRLKTHSRWRVRPEPGGILEWTSPTGEHYTTHPPAWIFLESGAPPPPEPVPVAIPDDDPPF